MPQIAVAPALGRAGDFGQLVFLDGFVEIFSEFRGFADVEHVENRLFAEEHESADALLVLGSHLHLAQWLFGSKMRVGALQQLEFFLEFGSLHLLQIFFETLEAFFDLAEIADHQIEFDILDVAEGIDPADVRDGGIFEYADHVGQCIDLSEMTDVAAFLQRLLSDGADVDVFDGCVRQLFGVVECRQFVETIVGHLGDSDVGLARIRVACADKCAFVRIRNRDVLPT